MKKILVVIILTNLSIQANCQSINLEKILTAIYFPDKATVKTDSILALDYIIPAYFGFIDTVSSSNYPVKINYLRDEKAFEKKLLDGKELKSLSVTFNKLLANSALVTIEINITNKLLYFGNQHAHFYTEYDRRKIKIIYDKKQHTWRYFSVIKIDQIN
ncbi:MAG TPA: hypothetical protein VK668_21160 [Mucilaginibacter sp.]|nr:hypothetical protein [Mucilaginibacter sp.]